MTPALARRADRAAGDRRNAPGPARTSGPGPDQLPEPAESEAASVGEGRGPAAYRPSFTSSVWEATPSFG